MASEWLNDRVLDTCNMVVWSTNGSVTIWSFCLFLLMGHFITFHEKKIHVCNCSYSRSADQMCRQDSRVHLSAEEEIAAEESLSIYCKPVELYNILQRRAVGNVIYLIVNISTCFLLLYFVCSILFFFSSFSY